MNRRRGKNEYCIHVSPGNIPKTLSIRPKENPYSAYWSGLTGRMTSFPLAELTVQIHALLSKALSGKKAGSGQTFLYLPTGVPPTKGLSNGNDLLIDVTLLIEAICRITPLLMAWLPLEQLRFGIVNTNGNPPFTG